MSLPLNGSMSIPNELAHASEVTDALSSLCEQRGVDKAVARDIRAAVHEAVINAIVHGNQEDASRRVHVSWRLEADRVEIAVADEGEGYSPDAVPDPTKEENLQNEFGRGLAMMRHLMDEVCHEPPGNRIVMVKYLKRRG